MTRRIRRITRLLTCVVGVGLLALPVAWSAFLPLTFAQSAPPAVTAVAVVPAHGATPAELAITGSNFGPTLTASDSVTVSGLEATIVSWSDTAVVVDVPAGAPPGPVVVATAAGASHPVPWSGIERGFYALTPTGHVVGYGSVSTYGDLTTIGVTAAPVALTLTPNGHGYWILTAAGQVYAFGDAPALGSPPPGTPAVALTPTPDGQGYWVLSRTGMVYAFGDATLYGHPTGVTAVGFQATPDGRGYWVLAQDGVVYAYGDAKNDGSWPGAPLPYPNGTALRVKDTATVYVAWNGQLRPVPDQTILHGLGIAPSAVHVVPSLAGEQAGPPLVAPFPAGTVVAVGPASAASYYLDVRGVLRPATPAILTAMGFNPAAAVHVPALGPWPVGPALVAPFPYAASGTLWRVAGTKAVYVVVNSVLHKIATPAVLDGMGLSWSAVHVVPKLPPLPVGAVLKEPVGAFPTGTVLRIAGQGALALVVNGTLRHLADKAVFTAMGLSGRPFTVVKALPPMPVGPALTVPVLPPAPSLAVALAATPDGHGYWILGADGTVRAFGDAGNFGSPPVGTPAAGLAPTPDGQGYLVFTDTGTLLPFGDAVTYGASPGALAAIAVSAVPPLPATVQSVGWGYFDTNRGDPPSAWFDLQTQYRYLSAIAPDWFGLWTNSAGQPVVANYNPGAWTTQMMASVTSYAQAHGVAVWPSVGWPAPGNLDLLRSPENRAAIISQIVAIAEQGGYNGMTIDFEGMGPNDATAPNDPTPAYQVFNTFVSELAAALHAVGKTLMVAVYPAPYPDTIYDYPVLAASADYLNVMMYPEFTNGFPSNQDAYPGPTAGLPWVSSLLSQDLATGVNPAKLLLGLAPYGYYWTFTPDGYDPNASGYMSDYQQQQLVAEDHLTAIWDPWEAAEVFTAGPPAVAPPAPLTNNLSASAPSPAVEDLQALLDYILIRYAVTHGATSEPIYLVTDGWYGPETTAAVTLFQKEFGVKTSHPGVYDAATQQALQQVITAWDIGETTYWDETPQSIAAILKLVAADHLGGVAPWRLGFESAAYWQALASTFTVAHLATP